MTNFDPRIEGAGHHLCHVLGENRGAPMSPKDRHDIFFTVRRVGAYWKRDSDAIRAENHALRWNELRLYLKRVKPEGYENTLAIMERLDKKESIR